MAALSHQILHLLLNVIIPEMGPRSPAPLILLAEVNKGADADETFVCLPPSFIHYM